MIRPVPALARGLLSLLAFWTLLPLSLGLGLLAFGPPSSPHPINWGWALLFLLSFIGAFALPLYILVVDPFIAHFRRRRLTSGMVDPYIEPLESHYRP